MKKGLTFQEWSDTFTLTPEEEEKLAGYAHRVQGDELFQRLFALMEFQIIRDWKRIETGKAEDMMFAKMQMDVLTVIRRKIQALADKHTLAARKEDR